MNRYKEISIATNQDRRQYYTPVKYPNIPASEDDLYLIATAGDRYDKFAYIYYGDITMWWIIAKVNPHAGGGLHPTPGAQIRIPTKLSTVMEQFRILNR
jgi:hypothetical protein